MRTVKYIVIMLFFFMGGMAFVGCEKNNAANSISESNSPEARGTTKPASSEVSNGDKQLPDTIAVLPSKVDNLSKNLGTIEEGLNKLSKEIEDLRESTHVSDVISWVISIIALTAAIIALIGYISVQKRADRHRSDIRNLDLRINSLEEKPMASSTRTKSGNSGVTNSEYAAFASRIGALERQIETLKKSQTSSQEKVIRVDETKKQQGSINEQTGYFGLPAQMSPTEAYFKRLSDTREPESLFKVTVRDAKASFRPIEGTQYLNEIKSNDDIKLALDIQGCAPSEATQMRVVLPGEAKKDGNRWIIIKKAAIILCR